MAVLTKNRDTREVAGDYLALTVKSDKTVYAGAIAAINANAEVLPAADAAGLRVIGRIEHQSAGGKAVLIKRGTFLWDNSAADPIAAAEIGAYCYVADDQTVRRTGGLNDIVAGLVRGVTADGVYVDTTMNPDGAAAGATAGAQAAAGVIAADLSDSVNGLIKPAAKAEAEAAITADLALDDGSSEIKSATLEAAGNVRLVEAPADKDSPGVKGDMAIDGSDIYLCTATNTWVKAALVFATWGD
jgi:hypothetical protein